MAVYSFEGKVPRIGKSAYVHEGAHVIGDVDIGGECFIGAGAVIRGDYGAIIIGPRTAIQEGCIIHAPILSACEIGSDVTIGHGAIVHCERIEDSAVIGMGAILSFSAVIEKGAIVAEGGVVASGQKIPARKVAAGNPARVIGETTEEQQALWAQGKKLYVDLSHRYPEGLKRL